MKRHHIARLRSARLRAALGISLISSLVSVPSVASASWKGAERDEHRREQDRPHKPPKATPDLVGYLFPNGIQTLDGSANNLSNPDWGQANELYSRVAGVNYADDVAAMVEGPSPRYVSNRVFNDIAQTSSPRTG